MAHSQKILFTLLGAAVALSLVGTVTVWYGRVRQEHGSAAAQAAAQQAAGALSYSHAVTLGGVTLQAAYAQTEAAREQGLSDTPSLGANQGMLFFYDAPQVPLFWMKDMHYPLDMIWIAANGTVADVTADALVQDFPKTYSPKVAVQYVLEVNAGFAAQHGIAAGTPVAIGS